MDMLLYALLNKKVKSAITGIASCQVIGTNLIFNFTDGTSQTMIFPTPKDGVSVINVSVDSNGHLITTLSDGNLIDAGAIPTIKGDKGDDGFSPSITENEDNNENVYKLDIETKDGTITTPNLKGSGSGDLSNYYTKSETENLFKETLVPLTSTDIDNLLGDILS